MSSIEKLLSALSVFGEEPPLLPNAAAAPMELLSKPAPPEVDPHLCEQLIEEILSRVPVKSVLRFRCVSKSWLSLISDQRFIESHLRNSTKNHIVRVIFQCDSDVIMQCSLQKLLNESSSIDQMNINHELLTEALLMGCCNGLVCIIRFSDKGVWLWNPATMVFMELPKLKGVGTEKYGFGWDGAYKVFASSTHRGIKKGNIYSSKTNSWKTVELGSLSVCDTIGVFACGKIHWIIAIGKNYFIECFDLESEEFGRIKLPYKSPNKSRKFSHTDYSLAEIGGCLHLLCLHHVYQRSYVVVWVMKESAWSKLFTFPLVFEPTYMLLHPFLGGGPNGKIFLIIEDNFFVYDGKDVIVLPACGSMKHLQQGHVCVESLVSPNFTTPS